ncbi:hypothetical protein H9Y04_41980 [Streptomyces sp. TRM66268-LWL]|uniref:Integral membrane protein n=1 Tax=Streptomyces polyasparticus TaxID=2767826 RepID=A0ABR7SUD6_9ACTN|nr:hypothetical protein [Streptomyces polyasparticus]MBC9719107.1 hypothetical protein [Streptomyces polyasparticus]
MNTPYVPISAGQRPDAHPMEPADAARWAAAGVPRWATGGFLALLLCTGYLAVLVVVGATASDTPSCTDAAPCRADWSVPFLFLPVLLAPYCVWRFPWAAAVLLPPGAGFSLALLLMDDAGIPGEARPVMAVFTALVLFVWAGVLVGIRARSRQRALARAAAGGLRACVPQQLPRSKQGMRRILAGTGLCLIGALLLTRSALAEREIAGQARGAERVTARVLGPDGESHLRVRMPDGTARSLPATYPDEFRRGSEAGVMVDGDWARLVAQPHDETMRHMGALLLITPGVGMLVRGVLLHRRLRILRTTPQPVLRVLISENEGPTVVVRTESEPERSFLRYDRVRERAALLRGSSGNGIPWNQREAPRQAVLYGELHDGADIVILTMAGKGKARVHGGTAVRGRRN